MHLNLTYEQSEVLREVLAERLQDLRREIAESKVTGYKEQLRHKRGVLLSILEPLGAPLPDRVTVTW